MRRRATLPLPLRRLRRRKLNPHQPPTPHQSRPQPRRAKRNDQAQGVETHSQACRKGWEEGLQPAPSTPEATQAAEEVEIRASRERKSQRAARRARSPCADACRSRGRNAVRKRRNHRARGWGLLSRGKQLDEIRSVKHREMSTRAMATWTRCSLDVGFRWPQPLQTVALTLTFED